MISLQARKHDNFSVEFKFGFTAEEGAKNNDFSVNTWIFIPSSMGINPQSYSKDQFYWDIKSNVRLITPVFTLKEFSSETAKPYKRLKDSITALAQGSGTSDNFVSTLKMYAAIFKSSLRNCTNSFKDGDKPFQLESLRQNYCGLLDTILDSYRSLYALVDNIPESEKRHFAMVDEYISHKVVSKAISLVRYIDLNNLENLSEERKFLVDFVLREKNYGVSKGFESIDRDPEHNREIIYNQSLQKKYIESELYINLDKRKDGRAIEQFYYSLAAGVSMVFATAVGWATQVAYGSNITVTLFVVIVISYMLKDRIKALMRNLFAHKLLNRYYDKKANITVNGHNIGKIKEAVDFLPGNKLFDEVAEIRRKDASVYDESQVFDEKLLLYRKRLMIDDAIFSADNLYPLSGVNEIMRLHLDRFMQKMDNPEVPINLMDANGKITVLNVPRTYCMHVIFQLKHLEQVEYRHLNIVMNRNGIIHIEEL